MLVVQQLPQERKTRTLASNITIVSNEKKKKNITYVWQRYSKVALRIVLVFATTVKKDRKNYGEIEYDPLVLYYILCIFSFYSRTQRFVKYLCGFCFPIWIYLWQDHLEFRWFNLFAMKQFFKWCLCSVMVFFFLLYFFFVIASYSIIWFHLMNSTNIMY